MNEQLTKQLIRQLKFLNIWITFFGSLVVVGLVVMAFLLFTVVGFIRETNAKIESVKTQASDSVNLKKQACEGDDGFSNFLRNSTNICE